jgi:hypothetical protein
MEWVEVSFDAVSVTTTTVYVVDRIDVKKIRGKTSEYRRDMM